VTAPGKAGRDDAVAEVALQLGYVRRFAVSCGVRFEHLDDFAQDVAVTALQRIEEGAFRPDPGKTLRESVRAWLSGIVRFRAMDLRRAIMVRDRVIVAGPTDEHPVEAEAHAVPSPEARAEAREELEAFAKMKLSQKQRETVALAAQGYTAREIGERLGIPEETAASCVKRARASYRAAMTRERAKRRG
jgi:RNA polymerase sigma factor (sigma-70 family)